MSFERIIGLALWAYPSEVRRARGAEIRDTALEASGESRLRLLRESLALVSAGMRTRARAAASLLLGASADGALSLRSVGHRVARTYAGAWSALLSASALYHLTDAACHLSMEQRASPIVSIVAIAIEVAALAAFPAFVISRAVSMETEGHKGVHAALSTASRTAGEMALTLLIGSIFLVAAANLTKLAVLLLLGVAFGASPSLGGMTGGGIADAGAVGAVPFVVLLTMWSVALPVVAIERPGGMRSLARSREIVRGNVLRTLVVVTIMVAVVAAAHLLGGLLTATAGSIGAAIVLWPVAPIPILVATALYLELGEAPRDGTAASAEPGLKLS